MQSKEIEDLREKVATLEKTIGDYQGSEGESSLSSDNIVDCLLKLSESPEELRKFVERNKHELELMSIKKLKKVNERFNREKRIVLNRVMQLEAEKEEHLRVLKEVSELYQVAKGESEAASVLAKDKLEKEFLRMKLKELMGKNSALKLEQSVLNYEGKKQKGELNRLKEDCYMLNEQIERTRLFEGEKKKGTIKKVIRGKVQNGFLLTMQ